MISFENNRSDLLYKAAISKWAASFRSLTKFYLKSGPEILIFHLRVGRLEDWNDAGRKATKLGMRVVYLYGHCGVERCQSDVRHRKLRQGQPIKKITRRKETVVEVEKRKAPMMRILFIRHEPTFITSQAVSPAFFLAYKQRFLVPNRN